MNREAVENFRREIGKLQEQYERALAEIEKAEARQKGIEWEALKGKGRQIAVEAQVRKYLLDPILNALGWETDTAAQMVVEDGLDPVGGQEDSDAERRRLDYHGRVNKGGRSLLIVEAKRPSISLPRNDDSSVSKLIALALRSTKKSSGSPVSAEWGEILTSARDYSNRVMTSSNAAPMRFVISNGEWFVIFRDVGATLLSNNPEALEIVLFTGLDDVLARSDEFCRLLGYQDLSGYVPPQHPGALSDFVPQGEEAVCARVVDVFYGQHGDRQPILSMRVAIWVRTPKGAWILFQKRYEKDFVLLSDDGSILRKAMTQLKTRAGELLSDLSRQRKVRFANRLELEALPPRTLLADTLSDNTSIFIEQIGKDQYRLLTTEEVQYLIEDPTFKRCPGHDWGTCKKQGNAVGERAITAQNCEPPSFFPSGSLFHCAHAAIHSYRRDKCLLLAFEQYFCCRQCAFLDHCWPDKSSMPCLPTQGS